LSDSEARLLRDQVAHYRAWAPDYEAVYRELDPDLPALERLMDDAPLDGDVLELACGTGRWTERLARRARTLTAVDAAPEMLAIARERAPATVAFVHADLFAWRPERSYDAVVFCFWLTHVPPSRLAAFWALVGDCLRPGGTAVFLDTGPAEQALEEVLEDAPAPAARRVRVDGGAGRVVKTFASAADVEAALAGMGWRARVRPVGERFIFGPAEPPRR